MWTSQPKSMRMPVPGRRARTVIVEDGGGSSGTRALFPLADLNLAAANGPYNSLLNASGMLEALTHRHGVPACAQIAIGSPKDTILDFVDHTEADVLIIGRSSPTGSAGRLTDLTYAIVRDSPFSVLSVQDSGGNRRFPCGGGVQGQNPY